jgi:RNA polymerase sigma factor (TIGR02999 family)
MIPPSKNEMTQLLADCSKGNKRAMDELMPLVYTELRNIAAHYLGRERASHTLQPTALVHEVYLELIDQSQATWQSRAHFFGAAARLMRRILVDHARARNADKRGGDALRVSMDEAVAVAKAPDLDLIALDDALEELARLDPQQSRVVEMRFFGGLSIEETADVLEISPATVKRNWTTAKAWLRRQIKEGR